MVSLKQVGFVNRLAVRAKEHVNQLTARNHQHHSMTQINAARS